MENDNIIEVMTTNGNIERCSVYYLVEISNRTFCVLGAENNTDNSVFVAEAVDTDNPELLQFQIVKDQNIIDEVMRLYKTEQES